MGTGTFSGNQGLKNGMWYVLVYEWMVLNESALTAPSKAKMPLDSCVQTTRVWKKKCPFYCSYYIRD